MYFLKRASAVGACLFAISYPVQAAIDFGLHQGCAATSSDFRVVKLATAPGPTKMDFDARENNAVDVYFIQKTGEFRKYDGATKQIVEVGKLAVPTGSEDGLIGIALDPKFKTNQMVFLMYSFEGGDESTFRIARFKLADGKLDLASEKIILKINSKRAQWHTSGSMQFDAYGDLWVAIGDNEKIEQGPANTADLRGGIIRIHPDDSQKGYSIPKGNFGEFFASKFRAAGNEALAKEYENPAMVLPEIYVKGTRNAYTISLDPVRRWLTWGDVGPDQGKISEEYNLVKSPVYAGWPYFSGEQDMGGVSPYGTNIPSGLSRKNPLNGPNVPGVKQLPEVREPIFVREQACAMTGPILRYNGESTSPIQFPPHLNRSWVISGCDKNFGFRLMGLNAAGEAVTKNDIVFEFASSDALVDLKQGPDGAMYYISYAAPGEAIYGSARPVGGSINRIEYTGSCKDPNLLLEKPTNSGTYVHGYQRGVDTKSLYSISQNRIETLISGNHEFEIVTMQGKVIWHKQGSGNQKYSLGHIPGKTLYVLRFTSGNHATSQIFYQNENE
ncbi:MAG: PQQ-dependent sugar dehydrogenase [Fibrobacterota bacterium]|nr:PQQ-dependent sugar dehydrogenase [Fibrobacterota bacterium]